MNRMVPMETQEKRIHWVDSLRAFGILLVVLAHHENDIPGGLLKYIYSFHIPLFFFISGFLHHPEKYRTAGSFIFRRLRTLILPYFALSLASYALVVSFSAWQNGISTIEPAALGRSIWGILVSSNGIIPLPNPPMWFIPCLFILEVLFYLAHVLTASKGQHPGFLIAVLALLSAMGLTYCQFYSVRLPWGIDTAFNALPFYGVGFLANRLHFRQYGGYKDCKILLMAALLLAVSFCLYDRNGFVNLAYNKTGGDFILLYLSSLSAIMFLAMVCMALPRLTAVEYVGRNTIVVLAFHLNAYSLVWRIPRLTDYLLSASYWGTHLLGLIPLSMMQIVFTVPAMYVIRTYFPFILGVSVPKDRKVCAV